MTEAEEIERRAEERFRQSSFDAMQTSINVQRERFESGTIDKYQYEANVRAIYKMTLQMLFNKHIDDGFVI